MRGRGKQIERRASHGTLTTEQRQGYEVNAFADAFGKKAKGRENDFDAQNVVSRMARLGMRTLTEDDYPVAVEERKKRWYWPF